ncbi:MAG: hypothetical protein JO289_18435 [Xanthobacteraceae bacterium]|nr:hypothetical protein [Xanthobacteraceae bacterium]
MHITYSHGTTARAQTRVELRMKRKNALIATAGMIIALLFGSARAQNSAPAAAPDTSQGAQTLKERLGDKGSDEQRVDNCKVAPERRGSKVRPDGCGHEINPGSMAEPK